MINANLRLPPPVNEPIQSYAPGSAEKLALKAELRRMSAEQVEIPLLIGGQRVHTGKLAIAPTHNPIRG